MAARRSLMHQPGWWSLTLHTYPPRYEPHMQRYKNTTNLWSSLSHGLMLICRQHSEWPCGHCHFLYAESPCGRNKLRYVVHDLTDIAYYSQPVRSRLYGLWTELHPSLVGNTTRFNFNSQVAWQAANFSVTPSQSLVPCDVHSIHTLNIEHCYSISCICPTAQGTLHTRYFNSPPGCINQCSFKPFSHTEHNLCNNSDTTCGY